MGCTVPSALTFDFEQTDRTVEYGLHIPKLRRLIEAGHFEKNRHQRWPMSSR